MACVVQGCKSHSSRKESQDSSITFHRFPSDEAMKIRWSQIINKPNWTPKKHSRICSSHFSEDSFVLNDIIKRRRLKPDTIPTLNIPAETVSFAMKTSPSHEIEYSQPGTSADYIFEGNVVQDPLNITNETKHLKRKFTSCGTNTDSEDKYIPNAKKIHLLEKQVENLKTVSKRRLRKINTLTKTISRLRKRNADLYSIIVEKLNQD